MTGTPTDCPAAVDLQFTKLGFIPVGAPCTCGKHGDGGANLPPL